ncbi:MAG: hypothetical protein M1820_004202 [Bogoriella megaspora]|nr:MAG: hypothetical protein M1820_004202 [Bogoriella megaspora]
MVALALLLAGCAVTGVLGAPRPDLSKALNKRATYTPSGEGIGDDGYFYSIWSDKNDDMNFSNDADGEYTLTWSGDGDVVCGKGWKNGSAQTITYSGTYEPDGGSFLSLYGWFTNPLTEYYILENFGTADPSYGTELVGNLTSDGSVYAIHKTVRENAPSIEGASTNFNQFWSIRQDKRTGGTINTANHFDAWKAAGLQFEGFHYQILATEGISGSGKSNIKVASGGSSDSSASSPAAEPSSTVRSVVAPSSVASSTTSDAASSTFEAATSTAVSSATSSSSAAVVAAPPSSSKPASSKTVVAPPAQSTASASSSSTTFSSSSAASSVAVSGVSSVASSSAVATPISEAPTTAIPTSTEAAEFTTTEVVVTVVTETITADAASTTPAPYHRHAHRPHHSGI